MVLNRVGLTGATGMLGRHVRAALEKVGAQVVAVSRASVPGSEAGGWDLADWRLPTELDALFPGVQAIVHAGAMVPTDGLVDEGRMFNANVRACVNLGQWAISTNVPLIYVSGAIVYEDTDKEGHKEDAALGWNGLGSFYGFSKLLAEDVLRRLCRRGLRLAVVRPSSIYGCGLSPAKMISRFLVTAREGGVIELFPPACDRVDLIHAADVSRAILAILERDIWDTFNIASGRPVSIKELAEACVSVAGRGGVSLQGDKTLSERDPITRFSLNTDRAKNQLVWQPLYDIEQGLGMMLQERV